MNGLYPIIRRVRRPMVPLGAAPLAPAGGGNPPSPGSGAASPPPPELPPSPSAMARQAGVGSPPRGEAGSLPLADAASHPAEATNKRKGGKKAAQAV